MKTIWVTAARRDLMRRLNNLTPGAQPAWGKMSAGQMLIHCTDAMRMLIGEKKVAPKTGPFRNPILRHFIIHWAPWPKGAPTAPELIPATYSGNWKADMAAFEQVLERMVQRGPRGPFEEHPAFGALSPKDVGALMWKHINHHLRQFQL